MLILLIHFLKNELGESAKLYNSVNDTRITINHYCIHIIKTLCPSYYRGYRPEISYINISIDTKNKLYATYWEDIYIKTEMYSNRIKPVRLINDIKDIDIQELLDDDYALKNTISKEKMDEWDSWKLY